MGNVVQPLWSDCPALTRLLVVGYPAMSLVLELVGSLDNPLPIDAIFNCSFANAGQNLHIWALFIGPFYRPFNGGMAFLMVLFELFMAMQYFPSRERELGSTIFLAWLLLLNALMGLAFITFMFGMSFISSPMYLYQPLQGLWPIVMVCLTRRCLSDPTGSTSFWGLTQVPNKWYPIFLGGVFCLLGGLRMPWDIASALLVGYGYPYLQVERLLPSRERSGGCERRWPCCGCASGRPRSCLGGYWVMASDTPGYDLETGDRRYTTMSDFGRTGSGGGAQLSAQGRTVQSNSFTVFSGSGNRLGDAEDTPAAVAPAAEPPAQPPSQPAQAQTSPNSAEVFA